MAVNVQGQASDSERGPSGILDAVSSALATFGKAVGGVGAVAVGSTAALIGFGKAFSGFVSLANPAVFEQFNMAMSDMMAVIGQGLVPIFQTVFIPVVRAAADALMQLAPAGASLAAAFEPLIPIITDLFAGAIGILAEAAQAAAPFLLAFARVISDVARFVGNAVRDLLALVGIDMPGAGVKPGGSVGAATRQAGHMDPMEAVKTAQRSAFSLGTASADPMGKMADAAAATKARADEIYQWLTQTLPKLLTDLPRLFAIALKEATKAVGGAVDRATGAPAGTTASFGAATIASPVAATALAAGMFGERITRPVDVGGVNLNPFSAFRRR